MTQYKNKRKSKKSSKLPIYRFRTFITNLFCCCLTIIVTISFWPNPVKKSDKNNTLNKESKIANLSGSTEELNNIKRTKPVVVDNFEKISKNQNIEELKEILQTDSYYVLEIAYMLEQFNLTYEDLLKYVSSIHEYNQELQTIFNQYPNLASEQLIEILKGKTTNLRNNLFIGDSRTKGMLISGVIDEDNSVYGVGYGYNWLIGNGFFALDKTNALNGAINDLETKMSPQELYNIVIWLGVNDYGYIDANKYFKKFEELATDKWSNYNIYVVSVGPVKENDLISVTNAGINKFNASLKELVESSTINNLKYVDLNLNKNSINTYDYVGLHYSENDYQNIYNIITETITKDETDDINSILSIFYEALKTYDNNLNYPNEIKVSIKILEKRKTN